MKIEDLKNTKIYLSSVDNKLKFKNKVKRLGIKWDFNDNENPIIRDIPFIYIDEDLVLLMNRREDYESFCSDRSRQIFLDEVLSIEEPEAKYEFKPFDKVLIRDNNFEDWHIGFFSTYTNSAKTEYPYRVTHGYTFKQCIPYEGNEHLLGTTNSPD